MVGATQQHTRFYFNEQAAASEPASVSMLVSDREVQIAVASHDWRNLLVLAHLVADPAEAPANLTTRVATAVSDLGLHRRRFEKIQVAVVTPDFCLVPQAYAEAANASEWLQFAAGMAGHKRAAAHRIHEATFCFGIDNELAAYLEKTFVHPTLKHAGLATLQLHFSQQSLGGADLFLNLHEGWMELSSLNQGQIVFYNTFSYTTAEDVLYYLLFAMEQLGRSPADTRLAFAGEVAASDALLATIGSYVKELRLVVGQPQLTLPAQAAALPAHYYFTLFNQHVCEL